MEENRRSIARPAASAGRESIVIRCIDIDTVSKPGARRLAAAVLLTIDYFQCWKITTRPSIVATTISTGAALCQCFTSFGMFKCALLTM